MAGNHNYRRAFVEDLRVFEDVRMQKGGEKASKNAEILPFSPDILLGFADSRPNLDDLPEKWPGFTGFARRYHEHAGVSELLVLRISVCQEESAQKAEISGENP